MSERPCPHCGAAVSEKATHCPKCREHMGERLQMFRGGAPEGGKEIRRGLLYMWLSAILYYFAAGHSSPINFPVPFVPILTEYLLPFLFLLGVGMTTFGLYRRSRTQ